MAEATVFIDDAVQGHLPGVCAKTGAPTMRQLTIQQDLTVGLGAAWVLLFFGPLGWLVLLAIIATRKRSTLAVKIPYGEAMLDVYVTAVRRVFHCAVLFGGVFVVVLALGWGLDVWQPSTTFGLAMITVALGAISVAACQVYVRRWVVGVRLDASGRWVTLSRVHSDFAAACRAIGRIERADLPIR